MIQLISPAKSLNFNPIDSNILKTKALFIDNANEIANILRKLSSKELQEILQVSDKLTQLNYERFQTWIYSSELDTKQAIFAYNGDVYEGIAAHSLSTNAIQKIQKNVRILSGMYGILKPLDGILPYRLEMSTKLSIGKNKNLYDYWSNTITDTLIQEIKANNHNHLINLASDEYFKTIKTQKIPIPIIECDFKEHRNGTYQMISFFAKKARGLMVRYIAEQNVTEPEHLIGFDYEGYIYNSELSNNTKFVFTR